MVRLRQCLKLHEIGLAEIGFGLSSFYLKELVFNPCRIKGHINVLLVVSFNPPNPQDSEYFTRIYCLLMFVVVHIRSPELAQQSRYARNVRKKNDCTKRKIPEHHRNWQTDD